MGLQETIKKRYPLSFLRKIDPQQKYVWHWIPSRGRSGGILSGIKTKRFDILSSKTCTHFIMVKVFDKKMRKNLCLVNVYGPAQDEGKEVFLTELAQICSENKDPMLVGGDFNILRFSDEKNKNFRPNRYSDMFNLIINSYALRDLTLNGGLYTWSNNHEDPTLEKLDRCLMSENWESLFPLSNLRKIPRYLSDHNPLLLCTDQDKIKNKTFSFENSWFKQEDFLPKIQEIWGRKVTASSAVERWYIKINRVKKFLKGWGLNLKGQVRRYKHLLQDELTKLEKREESSSLPADLLDKKTFIQTELQKLLEEEEEYWHKRSNLNWLLQGDNNTAFFQKVANGKKRKNTIFCLQKDEKSIVEDEKILEHATMYYKDLFGPSENPTFKLDSSCWDEQDKVTQEENDLLCRPFTLDEIQTVIFSLEKNSAPGPDHIPVEFYQNCWEIIKEDTMDMFLEFEIHNLDLGRLNYGVITLIPKLKEATKIQQYRPICLLNVSFKIFTKALMLRFENCMSRITNVCQSAFIKGRNIMDGVMALHEVLHDTKIKKKDGLILKLDFEKAYDKLNWDFLFSCLRQRGFCEKWCRWIRLVVTGGTLSVNCKSK